MKYLRKNKTNKVIGGIKKSIPPFNKSKTEERNTEIETEVGNKRQQILEFIIDEISKTKKLSGEKYIVKDNKSKDESTTENNNETTSKNKNSFFNVSLFKNKTNEKIPSSQSGDLYKINEDVIKDYLIQVYDRDLNNDFYELHNHLWSMNVQSNTLVEKWNSISAMMKKRLDSDTINNLSQDRVMEILLFNYLYAKIQEPFIYFYDMYFKINNQKTFFDIEHKYQIVKYNFSGNPGFFFTSNNDKYFADVGFNIENDIPKRCITKITKQVGVMGEQIPFNTPIYTIETLIETIPNISPIEQTTTGGKKTKSKRKRTYKKRKTKRKN